MTVLESSYVVRVIDQESSRVNVGGVGTLGALVMGVVDGGGGSTSMGSGASSECEKVKQKEENRKRKHKDRG